MDEMGLREVAERPATALRPVSPRTWREWDDLTGVFDQPTDPGWVDDRNLLGDELGRRWSTARRMGL
ncbi:type II toxin-antitoxin system prevent-host-death family antitoxin [Micromonospora sp. LOL_023]|uniref:type II toxin-antitoxin system prevent-host-death family antitoxin n=1 Tax=Micromonospora sp. LOL_023 TaxID=3345418 RepID=UPI003A8ADE54